MHPQVTAGHMKMNESAATDLEIGRMNRLNGILSCRHLDIPLQRIALAAAAI